MDDLRIGRRLGAGALLTLSLVLAACGSASTPSAAPSDAPASQPPASTAPEDPVSAPPSDGNGGVIDPGAKVVVPRPGQLDVHAVPADSLVATVEGSTIKVTATWTSGVEPCNILDSIVVDRGAGVFTITLREGHGPEEIACIAIAETHVTEFEIPDVAAGTYTLKDSQGLAPDVQVTVG